MSSWIYLLNEWWYILILAAVMVLAGIVKQNNVLIPCYTYFLTRIKSKKLLILCLSLIGGILPIPGRVIVSAGILDTIAPKDPIKRSKYGILDYIATHHYYLWSPLEKTILIPMAGLGVSYFTIISYTWPLLLVSLLVLLVYIWTLDSSDVSVDNIDSLTYKKQHQSDKGTIWYKFIDWHALLFVLCVIIVSNTIKHNSEIFTEYIKTSVHLSIIPISIIAFGTSLVLGSSSKFAGITTLLSSVFGMTYFTYFFAIEFAGYLISPCHKCVAIGMRYFNTPIKSYISVLSIWCLLLVIVGALTLFC
jgi:hypothetical protein